MFIEFTWQSISSVVIYSILFWILKFSVNFSSFNKECLCAGNIVNLRDFLFLSSCSYKESDMT